MRIRNIIVAAAVTLAIIAGAYAAVRYFTNRTSSPKEYSNEFYSFRYPGTGHLIVQNLVTDRQQKLFGQDAYGMSTIVIQTALGNTMTVESIPNWDRKSPEDVIKGVEASFSQYAADSVKGDKSERMQAAGQAAVYVLQQSYDKGGGLFRAGTETVSIPTDARLYDLRLSWNNLQMNDPASEDRQAFQKLVQSFKFIK